MITWNHDAIQFVEPTLQVFVFRIYMKAMKLSNKSWVRSENFPKNFRNGI